MHLNRYFLNSDAMEFINQAIISSFIQSFETYEVGEYWKHSISFDEGYIWLSRDLKGIEFEILTDIAGAGHENRLFFMHPMFLKEHRLQGRICFESGSTSYLEYPYIRGV